MAPNHNAIRPSSRPPPKHIHQPTQGIKELKSKWPQIKGWFSVCLRSLENDGFGVTVDIYSNIY